MIESRRLAETSNFGTEALELRLDLLHRPATSDQWYLERHQ
ncbi:MAG: hypothetical protein M0026_13985 [Nocardiopsaceae bacterium]|nr:hypothetical protein [Nocardiopsaceae bacterium]